ncbi:hypothetical protein GEMRC1_007495 [Eukaryota sp. GEM-RC1]
MFTYPISNQNLRLLSPHPFSLIHLALANCSDHQVLIPLTGDHTDLSSITFFAMLRHLFSLRPPSASYTSVLYLLHSLSYSLVYGFFGSLSVEFNVSTVSSLESISYENPVFHLPNSSVIKSLEFFSCLFSLEWRHFKVLGLEIDKDFLNIVKSSKSLNLSFEKGNMFLEHLLSLLDDFSSSLRAQFLIFLKSMIALFAVNVLPSKYLLKSSNVLNFLSDGLFQTASKHWSIVNRITNQLSQKVQHFLKLLLSQYKTADSSNVVFTLSPRSSEYFPNVFKIFQDNSVADRVVDVSRKLHNTSFSHKNFNFLLNSKTDTFDVVEFLQQVSEICKSDLLLLDHFLIDRDYADYMLKFISEQTKIVELFETRRLPF